MALRQIIFLSIFLFSFSSRAQQGNGTGGGRGKMNIGHFYGKVIDSASGKAIEYASVQLFMQKRDSLTGGNKLSMVGGQLTESNGDFSIENLPTLGQFILRIGFLGYEKKELIVSFGGRPRDGGGTVTRDLDKDLGNIKLRPDAKMLQTIVVDGSEPAFRLEIDKKVYDLDKNPMNAGTTAEDALKNVPSVNVDIDGNVTLRNAAPQIFVDGKPTTLSLDQIPSDAIQSIELITNPSAKYDASGGMAGIINIVLKKNRKVGYNGSIRAGVDMRGKISSGLDLNARQNKINFFVNSNLNQRKSIGSTHTDRLDFSRIPSDHILQQTSSSSESYHASAKAGFDFFIDNRNTLTASGSYNQGQYKPIDNLLSTTDTLYPNSISTSISKRRSITQRQYHNIGSTLAYKHLFLRSGEELTADITFNRSMNSSDGFFNTQIYDANYVLLNGPNLQKLIGTGGNQFLTIQTDFVNPISEKLKIESGLRAAIKNSSTINHNYLFSPGLGEYDEIPLLAGNYVFLDQVYAAYGTISQSLGAFGYQTGLRLESSNYKGTLGNTSLSFENNYPISLFPSAFLSYKLNDRSNVQLNYSRRINRPTFFQLIPFTDYSDSLNISRGNPLLNPEFTHALELSLQHVFNKANSFLVSAYFKNTNDLITRYQLFEYSSITSKQVLINTYLNANAAYSYGMEFTSKSSIKRFLDITFNFNLYNTLIDAKNIQANLSNQQLSWFSKLNANFKMPKNITFQVSGSYQSKTAMPVSSGGDRPSGGGGGGGGGGMFGAPTSTIQGYIKPNYGIDLSLKLEFLKDKKASLTLSVSDVLKTRINESYSTSIYFTQTTSRLRDQQIFRLNFSYNFGKFDVSIFKRRNNRANSEGGDTGN